MNTLKNIVTILAAATFFANCNSKPEDTNNFEEKEKTARLNEAANSSAMEKILAERNIGTEFDFVRYLQSPEVLSDLTSGNMPHVRAGVIAQEMVKRNLSPALWFTKEIQGRNSRIESGFCYQKNHQGREDCMFLDGKVQYALAKPCGFYNGQLSQESEIGTSILRGRAYDSEAGFLLYLSDLIYTEQTGKSPEGTSFDCVKERKEGSRLYWKGGARNGRWSRFPGMPAKIRESTTHFLELDKAYKARMYNTGRE